jgi:hypothetical protein
MLLWLHLDVTDGVTGALALALGDVIGFSHRIVTLTGASLGATKLAVAGFFLLSASERVGRVFRGESSQEHGALDLAVLGGAALILLAIAPTWGDGDIATLRVHFADLTLLTVAGCSAVYEMRHRAPVASRTAYVKATQPAG